MKLAASPVPILTPSRFRGNMRLSRAHPKSGRVPAWIGNWSVKAVLKKVNIKWGMAKWLFTNEQIEPHFGITYLEVSHVIAELKEHNTAPAFQSKLSKINAQFKMWHVTTKELSSRFLLHWNNKTIRRLAARLPLPAPGTRWYVRADKFPRRAEISRNYRITCSA